MPPVAWNARFNWLRPYILPIQQRQGIGPECPWSWRLLWSLPCPRGGRRHAMGPSGGWSVLLLALYGQKQGTPMEDARYTLYTKTKARPRLRNLPPNSANLLLHVQHAHLPMTLWKAADQHSPPDIDISNFGWEMKAGVLSPCIDPGPTGPPALMDVISCHRQAAGKHVQRSAAVRRKVSPARFTAYVNPGTNAAIPTRGRSKWMMRTKTNGELQEYEALDADSSADWKWV